MEGVWISARQLLRPAVAWHRWPLQVPGRIPLGPDRGGRRDATSHSARLPQQPRSNWPISRVTSGFFFSKSKNSVYFFFHLIATRNLSAGFFLFIFFCLVIFFLGGLLVWLCEGAVGERDALHAVIRGPNSGHAVLGVGRIFLPHRRRGPPAPGRPVGRGLCLVRPTAAAVWPARRVVGVNRPRGLHGPRRVLRGRAGVVVVVGEGLGRRRQSREPRRVTPDSTSYESAEEESSSRPSRQDSRRRSDAASYSDPSYGSSRKSSGGSSSSSSLFTSMCRK